MDGYEDLWVHRTRGNDVKGDIGPLIWVCFSMGRKSYRNGLLSFLIPARTWDFAVAADGPVLRARGELVPVQVENAEILLAPAQCVYLDGSCGESRGVHDTLKISTCLDVLSSNLDPHY